MNWPTATIEEVCETGAGGTPSRTQPNRYFGGGIPWVKSGELKETEILATEESLTQAGLDESAAKLISKGALLVALYGATVGRIGILGINAATNQAVCHVIPRNGSLDHRFLFYVLRNCVPSWLTRRVGGAQPNISQQIIKETRIPLPPLAEQRRIADILDRAEALRAKRRAALALLDTLPQAIFLEMFGDPVRNPMGWKKFSFEDVCSSRLGKMLDQKQQTGQFPRPYLRNANVQWFHFDLSSVLEMDFDEEDRREFRLKDGDVLICEGGEPGRAAIWRGEFAECYFQKALHRVRVNSQLVLPDYVVHLFWFLAHRHGLRDHVTSATIAHLTGEKLKAMQICIPPLALQHIFASRVTAVEQLKASHRASLAKLDELFASLQHRAFRGEL